MFWSGSESRKIAYALGLGALVSAVPGAGVFAGPFDGGWALQPAASTLAFQSIKGGTQVESSGFAALSGAIDEKGAASVTVHLESIDTRIDLRNVRMRFLFFETFLYPDATISVQVDPASIADLPQVRRKVVPVSYTLELHGIARTSQAEVAVTLLNDDLISVSSTTPVTVPVADFGLSKGLRKLEETAGLEIVPSASVSFDFSFARNVPGAAAVAVPASAEPSLAMEPTGDFGREECIARFDALSDLDGVFFTSGSAWLDPKSTPVLDELVGIITRCKGMVIEIAGHTDNVGSSSANLHLSDHRAVAVADYLIKHGIDAKRITTRGYGESHPVATNDTDEGRSRNRRIEFTVVDG
ncbi:OmpA family protein [Tropicimonas sp.]|uniref:OmpA family protein n=1 Tax=Tropicimonas sp. TaxID=2067044 RepID=UPI003A880902